MSILLIPLAFYLGGVVCMIGSMLGGMTNDPELKYAKITDYLYAGFACLLWPGFIIQQITTKDD